VPTVPRLIGTRCLGRFVEVCRIGHDSPREQYRRFCICSENEHQSLYRNQAFFFPF
jgi:hypothetical protein